MAQQYSELSEKHQQFIEKQNLFFVGTATADSRVNISPKGMDSLRVLDNNTVVWLNMTGSGNETAAHVQTHPRMTLLFTAFEGDPMILRLYGTAEVIHKNDKKWQQSYALFDEQTGARQIFELKIDLVQTSCGMAVPYYNYVGEREQLNNWAVKQGERGVKEYWKLKNQQSLDGVATHIMEKNT
jgi:pyridoxamine 5'-phosphate oxidase-like protein